MTRVEILGSSLELERISAPRPSEVTVIFLHEGLGCVGLWRDFPRRVVETLGVHALVYSRRGYGASEPVELPRPLTYMHEEAQGTLATLVEQTPGSLVLWGHSDGASIALIYAALPQVSPRLKALVLEAPHVICEEVSVQAIARAREAYLHGDLRPKLARWHGSNVDSAFWGWNRAWLDPGFRSWSLLPLLPKIRAPMLLLQGEQDEYGTLAQLDEITSRVSGPSERRVLPSCGHAPHREHPQETLAFVTSFLSTRL